MSADRRSVAWPQPGCPAKRWTRSTAFVDESMTSSGILRAKNPQQTHLSRVSADSFGFYHDMIRSSGAATFLIGDTFEATIAAQHFGRLTLYDRQLIGADHRRDPTHIKRDGFEHYFLQVLRSGRVVSGRPGEEHHLVPGDAVLFDATQPMRSIVDDGDLVTVILARDQVEAVAPDVRHLHGSILPRGETGSLGQAVLSFIRCASSFPETSAAGVGHFITSMLGQIQGRSDAAYSDAVGENNLELSRRLRAEIFIDNNLAADLSSDAVARSIGVSRSSLYRAMQAVGGVETVVKRRRAARLRLLISQQDKATSIGVFADKIGFSSRSYGSRAFKEIYGQSPGQFRATLRADAASAAQVLHPGRMRDWYGSIND
ncbi:AraC family transcriptional regulator [Methylobacterium sp. Leaf108]|uniref:helix-turn-helix domain-containing protein n=1 Tax=Methylobacterium sp. Leaf108 TaxID=1736256 RepID=UPI0009EC50E4|nr:AraC family transcriptional regulator [Methylobacterium sp. Leaf108]